MSKETSIKYTIIKEANIAKSMESCGRVASSERKNTKLDGSVWETVVCTIMDNVNYNEYACDTTKEGIDAIRKVLFTIMEKSIYSSGVVIPETGLDRDGKTITLLNEKTNSIKWSSWDQTRRIFSYLGDIAKVLAHDKGDMLYPEPLKVAARCDILKECKAGGSPLDQIVRLSGQIAGFAAKIEACDSIEANTAISALIVPNVPADIAASSLIAKLDTIIGNANDDEKELIKTALFAVATRYFV